MSGRFEATVVIDRPIEEVFAYSPMASAVPGAG